MNITIPDSVQIQGVSFSPDAGKPYPWRPFAISRLMHFSAGAGPGGLPKVDGVVKFHEDIIISAAKINSVTIQPFLYLFANITPTPPTPQLPFEFLFEPRGIGCQPVYPKANVPYAAQVLVASGTATSVHMNLSYTSQTGQAGYFQPFLQSLGYPEATILFGFTITAVDANTLSAPTGLKVAG